MKKMDQGWTVTFASMIALIVGSPVISVGTVGVFMRPMTEEFGWSRGLYFSAFTIGGLVGSIGMLLAGMAADRFGARRSLLVGTTLYALTGLGFAFIGPSFQEYLALWVVVGLLAMSTSALIYVKVVSGWMDKRRGLAIAIVMVGMGIGNMIIPPATTYIIDEYGWRAARMILAALSFIVAFPVVFFFVREAHEGREHKRLQTSPVPQTGEPMSVALKSWIFWVVGASFLLSGGAIAAFTFNIPAVLHDHGFGADVTASCLFTLAVAQVAGRFGCGFLLDKIQNAKGALLWLAFGCAGIWIIPRAFDVPTALAGSALLGLSYAAEQQLTAYFMGRYFGVKNLGSIYGAMSAVYLFGISTGPMVVGGLYDKYHDYSVSVIVCESVMAAAALLLVILPAYIYKRPSEQRAPMGATAEKPA